MTAGEASHYAVVDTAQDSRLMELVAACRRRECLVSGSVHPDLAALLPWLVAWDPFEPLARAWAREGVGKGWGILCASDLPFAAMRAHLKTFLNARLPDGRVVWFRFYDPVVLQMMLRASTPEEQAVWFRKIDQYILDEEDQPHRFAVEFDNGRLRVETLPSLATAA